MPTWLQIILAVIGSSGLWTFISAILQRRAERKNVNTRMLLGLGHDRIIWLCEKYIAQGWISADDYENLYTYLYLPYEEMGGNGSAKRLMDIVKTLPIRSSAPDDRQIRMDI